MKTIAAIVLASTMLVLTGCKKDEANPATTAQNQLVGTWSPQSATVNGAPVPVADVLQFVSGAVSARYTFNANSTFTYTEYDNTNTALYTATGTTTVSGNTITITTTAENGTPVNPPSVITGTFAIAGNTLTITLSEGGVTAVIVFSKV